MQRVFIEMSSGSSRTGNAWQGGALGHITQTHRVYGPGVYKLLSPNKKKYKVSENCCYSRNYEIVRCL